MKIDRAARLFHAIEDDLFTMVGNLASFFLIVIAFTII
jgi:hypothetical protein